MPTTWGATVYFHKHIHVLNKYLIQYGKKKQNYLNSWFVSLLILFIQIA